METLKIATISRKFWKPWIISPRLWTWLASKSSSCWHLISLSSISRLHSLSGTWIWPYQQRWGYAMAQLDLDLSISWLDYLCSQSQLLKPLSSWLLERMRHYPSRKHMDSPTPPSASSLLENWKPSFSWCYCTCLLWSLAWWLLHDSRITWFWQLQSVPSLANFSWSKFTHCWWAYC